MLFSPVARLHSTPRLPNPSLTTAGTIASNDTDEASTSNSPPQNSGTFSSEEVDKFRKMASEWWNPSGPLMALHTMNYLRVPLIRDGLLGTYSVDEEIRDGPTPLQGFKILDAGCGGGILAEPLARLGAKVTGE